MRVWCAVAGLLMCWAWVDTWRGTRARAQDAGAPSAGHHHAHMHKRFRDAESWSKQFDAPSRAAWQQPDKVIATLALAPDAVVADIGAGTGYFTIRLARAVHKGRVYAVDVEHTMLQYIERRAKHERLRNVHTVLATTRGLSLPGAVDVALIVDTYHHIADRTAYLQRLSSQLRPGGRVVVIDFRPESERGPPRNAKLAKPVVVEEFRQAGYVLSHDHEFLPDQYFLEFTKAP
jgi:ubiquinone/menaquinone biosynthesis C-methylase UbiE